MLREVSIQDLDEIRSWRNSPDVRQVMFTDHEITKEEHLAWWDNISVDKTKKQLMFLWQGDNAGVVNIFDIDNENRECHWGFFLSSDIKDSLQRMKLWQLLEKEAIEYVFNVLSCNKLICESFLFNQPVIEMHKRFGFVEVSRIIREKFGKKEVVVITELTSELYYDLFPDSVHKLNPVKYERSSIKIAFLGSSNLDFLSSVFHEKSSEYRIDCDCTNIAFGQYMIQVNDPNSVIRNTSHDYLVFIERLDDFIKEGEVISEKVLEDIQQRWVDYLEFIRNTRKQLAGVFLIGNPVTINGWVSSLNPVINENVIIRRAVKHMNRQLTELCADLPDTHILDMENLIFRIGKHDANPGKYWYMARAPFSRRFNECLSQHLIAMILSLEEKTARVIALDLDNTLWKGVIGDDGLEGITIGGDYPGNVYLVIQSLFKVFRDRGLALVLCSKNTEEVAFEVFEKHSGMVLEKEDLTAWRINWKPKPQNLMMLSEELDLGLASFCFIDDNPVEREEVRLSLPEVFVPELPVEISDWPDYIANLPELSDLGLTDEDKKRVNQYKIRSKIKSEEEKSGSREEFLLTLKMKVSMEKLSINNQQRVLQLLKKTNQFNVTTRRHNEADLKALIEHGECYAIRLQDRLGSDEIIGVLVVVFEDNIASIDTFILSCRVLGRGVETAVLSFLDDYLIKKNIKIIKGEIIPTERNTPILNLYTDHGFKIIDDNLFEHDLSEQEIKIPTWIRMK